MESMFMKRVGAKRKRKRQPEEAGLHEAPRNVDALLRLRRSIAESRPEFRRQESWRYGRLDEAWRMPKGIDSKMRLQVKGWPKVVKIGYRGPKAVRGLHPSGFKDVLVHNIRELEALNPDSDAARLASGVGAKLRALLITRAKELGIRILNPTGVKVVGSEK